jgi:hypothetical protein
VTREAMRPCVYPLCGSTPWHGRIMGTACTPARIAVAGTYRS